MKKSIILLLAGLGFLASCNRDINYLEEVDAEDRISIKRSSELAGELKGLNSSFSMQSKAGTNLQYTYKNFAESPHALAYTEEFPHGVQKGTSTLAQATSVVAEGDMIFVTWHLEGQRYGGAVSAYKLDFASGSYVYQSRIDFDDTDFHEAVAYKNVSTGNYEVFVVGQRSPASSGYDLAGHRGAIVGKLLYDYINDEFLPATTYTELPLPGYAANSLITSAGQYFIVTGNGSGLNTPTAPSGMYVTDYNLSNISEAANLVDGIFIAHNPFSMTSTSVDYSVLDRTAFNRINLNHQLNTQINRPVRNNFWPAAKIYTDADISSLDLERAGLTFIPRDFNSNGDVTWAEPLAALGRAGLYSLRDGEIDPGVHSSLAVAYDHHHRLIYVAAGGQGMTVLAGRNHGYGSSVNNFHQMGFFAPPVGGNLQADGFNVKDVSVYYDRYIALATGGTNVNGNVAQRGGVYFLMKD